MPPGVDGPAHLFLATAATAFGEVKLGINLARALAEEGHRPVFLAPSSLRSLFEGTGVRHLPVELSMWHLEREVPALLDREQCQSLVLVDVTAVLLGFEEIAVNPRFLDRLGVPVVALDIWSLAETDRRWDWGLEASVIPERALSFQRRLLPVPLVRPSAGPGVYDALPQVPTVATATRAGVRAEIGLGAEDRLILLATGRWQTAEMQMWTHHKRLVRQLPRLIFALLRRVGPRCHLLHVGPAPLPGAEAMEGRYHHSPAVSPDRFKDLLRSSDLMLSLNAASTAMLSAVASELPTMVVVNSHQGQTADAVLESLGGHPSAEVVAWVQEAVPLHRFRLWPLGLFGFLTPVLAENPFTTAFRTVELLDEEAFVETCRTLLFDAAVAEHERDRQRAYASVVRGLPRAADAFRAQLG